MVRIAKSIFVLYNQLEIDSDMEEKHMKMRMPDYVGLHTEMGRQYHPFAACVRQDDIAVETALCGEVLHIDLTADSTPVKYITLRWNFTAQEKRTDTVKVYGDVWERSYCNLEWRGIVPDRMMPWVCAVSNGSDQNRDYTGRYTECFGVKVRPNAMCMWQYDPAGVTLWMDVRCGGMGVLLEKRTLSVCDVLFGDYRDVSAFAALKDYYRQLCDDPLTVDHKVYGTNNWYYAYGETSHAEIMEDTRLLMDSCRDLPNKPYIVLDDGWQKYACDAPWDVLREGKFHDMKALSEEMRAMGARPGIWVRPLSDQHYEVTDKDSEMRSRCSDLYLDASHPAVLEYVGKLIGMLCDWGYTLIKHDFSTFDMLGFWGFERPREFAQDGWAFYNRSKTSAEIILDLYRVIYEASKDRALVLGCNVIGHLAAGLVHLNRTGDDTSGRDWERTRKYGVNALAFRMLHHEAFFLADADCIGIMGEIDWKMNREWMEAVAYSGTPMFVSPKPNVMSEAELAELREAYRVNSVQEDVLVPLDWMENVTPENWLLNGEEKHFNWYEETGIPSLKR